MKFKIVKDGKRLPDIEAADARVAGAEAVVRFGPGTYNVSLLREECDDGGEECPSCGSCVPPVELDMHDGVCKSCYDDYGSPLSQDEDE